MALFMTACGGGDTEDSQSDKKSEKDYVYSLDHMGTWYGFGSDGEEAEFEIKIKKKSKDSANVTLDFYGDNAHDAEEKFEIVFDSKDEAKEDTESDRQRVFKFSINENGKEELIIAMTDKSTGKPVSQSIEAGRKPTWKEAFESEDKKSSSKENDTKDKKDKKDTTDNSGLKITGKKSEYKKRYDELSKKEIAEGPQQEMNVASMELYQQWDALLNDVYNYLKESKSKLEFDKISKDELEWIKEKEAAIAESRAEFEGGSMAALVANGTAIDYTQKRCEYLISLID